ncbi:MAG: VOC family protein [Myxococcota bacterium]|nr:VOC family protein [Myxococcota bacterium]
MPFHHLAVATHDMKAIHRFYSEAMGFELVKVEMAGTPTGGRAKHFFYDCGDGEMMAFWELHDPALPSDFDPALGGAAGLPEWVNHYAFKVDSVAELHAARDRWLSQGIDAIEIDHRWCHSVYTKDPNGTLVEFCVTTGRFDAADRDRALAALERDDLEQDESPEVVVHRASEHRA